MFFTFKSEQYIIMVKGGLLCFQLFDIACFLGLLSSGNDAQKDLFFAASQ